MIARAESDGSSAVWDRHAADRRWALGADAARHSPRPSSRSPEPGGRGTLTSGSQFRPGPPPAYRSAQFLAELHEVSRRLADGHAGAACDRGVLGRRRRHGDAAGTLERDRARPARRQAAQHAPDDAHLRRAQHRAGRRLHRVLGREVHVLVDPPGLGDPRAARPGLVAARSRRRRSRRTSPATRRRPARPRPSSRASSPPARAELGALADEAADLPALRRHPLPQRQRRRPGARTARRRGRASASTRTIEGRSPGPQSRLPAVDW